MPGQDAVEIAPSPSSRSHQLTHASAATWEGLECETRWRLHSWHTLCIEGGYGQDHQSWGGGLKSRKEFQVEQTRTPVQILVAVELGNVKCPSCSSRWLVLDVWVLLSRFLHTDFLQTGRETSRAINFRGRHHKVQLFSPLPSRPGTGSRPVLFYRSRSER